MNSINKLWIFQADKILTYTEEDKINQVMTDFLKSWASHGDALKSDFEILEHKFIIVRADENQTKASGCSIDSLHQCIRQIDSEFHLNLLNRLLVSYEAENQEIKTLSVSEFKEKIRSSRLSPETPVYDLSISSYDEFKEKFKQPLKNSWAKIYLN
jgi:hypothetical protein